jgi:DeoR/GlpR family transcriptional regulator of sugar metabolism
MDNNRGNTLLPLERQLRILELIRKEDMVRVSELSEALNVSEMTIRRDLTELQKIGTLERTHGGAVYRKERLVPEYIYQNSINQYKEEKQRIARCAASLVEPHDTIFIGGGFTAGQLLRYIDDRLPIRAFTYNIGACEGAQGKIAELFIAAGIYKSESNLLSGPSVIETINRINANKAFIGAECLSLEKGLTSASYETAAIERSMINQTDGKVVVMADSSKLNHVAEIVIVPIKRIDCIVVNDDINKHLIEDLKKLGLTVIIA